MWITLVKTILLGVGSWLFLTDLSPVTANEDSEAAAVNISAILNHFMVGYDKRVRPNYGGIPVTVGVSLYILSIGDISENFMDFTFDMYFRRDIP